MSCMSNVAGRRDGMVNASDGAELKASYVLRSEDEEKRNRKKVKQTRLSTVEDDRLCIL